MFIRFLTTGGTIDKIYFDALSEFEVGESPLHSILADAHIHFDFEVTALMRKDSLELDDVDRQRIRDAVVNDDASRFVISHGTDTMVQTAAELRDIPDKRIVLTGALSPARFRTTDAIFNVGMAVAAVQTVAPGVYIAMNGRVFAADAVQKNRKKNRFEAIARS